MVESGFESVQILGRRGMTGLSDEATRGIMVASEASGSTDFLRVKEICQGTQTTIAGAEKPFANINSLKDVDGLDDMVRFLRSNCNNPNGIDGAIYEATVARRILDGQVPSSGSLQRISADGLPNANRHNNHHACYSD